MRIDTFDAAHSAQFCAVATCCLTHAGGDDALSLPHAIASQRKPAQTDPWMALRRRGDQLRQLTLSTPGGYRVPR